MITLCRCLVTTGLASSFLMCHPRIGSAQAVAVQQPVVQTFGASTTVSIPDRGKVRLGGVQSAASGRISPGPYRPGTNTGLERAGSSLTVSVFIHDLQAMDEALLAQGTIADAERDVWSARLNARRSRSAGLVSASQPVDRGDIAGRYEQLARDAERRSQVSLARLHWQVAAKNGSSIAQQRLRDLTP